jgi:predicted nucleic acid-binding protein
MKTVLLDTDVLINFLRGKEKARDALASLAGKADLCCSAITVAEIHAGMKEHERAGTSELLDSLIIVDVTREIAEKAGAYKRTIKSQSLELNDCLVAATAFKKHAILVTGNDKHYPMADIEKTVTAS